MSQNRKSILVTGGCGFIGSNLVAKLLKEGYQVRVLDNLSVGKKENIPNNVDLVVGDIRDGKLVSESLKEIGNVVHLAAHTNVIESIEEPELDFEINTKGTFNLISKSVENNVEKFVFASSNAAVGEQEPPITENAIPIPLSPLKKK